MWTIVLSIDDAVIVGVPAATAYARDPGLTILLDALLRSSLAGIFAAERQKW